MVLLGVTVLGATVCPAQKAKAPPAGNPSAGKTSAKEAAPKAPAEKGDPAKSAAPTEKKDPPRRIALRGGTVLTGVGPAIAGGTVLIEDDKIIAVGRDIVIPDGAEVVDVTGKFVFPGLVDAAGAVGLIPADATSGGTGSSVKDGLDPFSSSWERVLSGGVTSAFLAPRLTAPATGILGAVVKVRPGVAPEDLIVKDVAAVRASVGVSSGTSDTVTRWRSAEALGKALKGVEAYTKSREKYDKDLAKWKKDLAEWRKKVGIPDPDAAAKAKKDNGKTAKKSPSKKAAAKKADKSKKPDKSKAKKATKKKKPPKRPKAPRRPRLDPAKAALADVLARKIPLRVEAHRAEDIERTLDIAEKFKIRLVLEGATEAAAFADRMAELEVAVVAGPLLLSDPRRLEHEGHDPAGLGVLARAGVRIAVGSGSPRPTAARFLRLAAARAEACGLDRQAALASVTSTAADVLGVAGRVGSIAKGKDADLVIADRHPLDTACRIERVFIEGRPVYPAARP